MLYKLKSKMPKNDLIKKTKNGLATPVLIIPPTTKGQKSFGDLSRVIGSKRAAIKGSKLQKLRSMWRKRSTKSRMFLAQSSRNTVDAPNSVTLTHTETVVLKMDGREIIT